MTDRVIPLLLRDRTLEDEAFIYSSWLKSYHQNSVAKFTPNTIYFPHQTQLIKYLLENEKIVISCFPEDPSEIIGYCVYNIVSDALIIHYIYIKNMHRNGKFAYDIVSSLLPKKDGNLIIATSITDNFCNIRNKIPNAKIVFDPYYITQKRIY